VIEAAGAFDAWGSALVGGVLSAVATVSAVLIAQKFINDSKRSEEARRRSGDRRHAAEKLIVSIHNARDEAGGQSRGLNGNYPLSGFRNSLFVTYSALHGLPAYAEVDHLYNTIEAWREWTRARQRRGGQVYWHPDVRSELLIYQSALKSYAKDVIDLLNSQLERDPIAFTRPALPPLPNVPELRPES
jgi:isopenicillin N synthase-like dioxygenase